MVKVLVSGYGVIGQRLAVDAHGDDAGLAGILGPAAAAKLVAIAQELLDHLLPVVPGAEQHSLGL